MRGRLFCRLCIDVELFCVEFMDGGLVMMGYEWMGFWLHGQWTMEIGVIFT